MYKTTKERKYLWCKKCKNYPDRIVAQEKVITRREWDDECYQEYDTEYTGNTEKSYCQECDTILIEK